MLVPGGPDVDPALYGQSPDPDAGLEICRPLDDLDLRLLNFALDQDMPVLAICRGMQLLNVAFGGKLIQDIADHKAQKIDRGWESTYHQIYIAPDPPRGRVRARSAELLEAAEDDMEQEPHRRQPQTCRVPSDIASLIIAASRVAYFARRALHWIRLRNGRTSSRPI